MHVAGKESIAAQLLSSTVIVRVVVTVPAGFSPVNVYTVVSVASVGIPDSSLPRNTNPAGNSLSIVSELKFASAKRVMGVIATPVKR